MGPVVQAQPSPAAAACGGSGGGGKFPTRKLSGDLKLRLARLPSLGGGGVPPGGELDIARRGSAGCSGSSSYRGRSSIGHAKDTSGRGSRASGRRAPADVGEDDGGGGAAAAVRRLSMTSARDGFSLVPTSSGNVAVEGGVDSSRLTWTNPMSERTPWLAGSSRGSNNSGGRRGSSLETATKGLASGRGLAEGRGGEDGDGDNDSEHQEFMRELASHNGLQLRSFQGEDERARHRREVDRRVQIQENCVRRPSVGQSKVLLKAKILGSIGGGPFELLRAFRKMTCGGGTVIDFKGFREGVKKLNLGLTEPEILDFFRSFDADGSGGIDFSEFCEWMEATDDSADEPGGGDEEDDDNGGGDGGGGGGTSKGRVGGFRPSSGGSDKSVSKRKMRDAQAKVKVASERVPERTMAENEQLLRQKILGSIGGGPFQLLRAFRKMHRGRGTVVDLNDFREAVKTFSLGLGEPEVEAFFKGFDADGSGGIDFEEFCAWVGGTDAAGAADGCLLPDSNTTKSSPGFIPGVGGGGGGDDDTTKTPAMRAQERVTRAFREQAGKMTSETLHKVLREKLISTVKPGGGTLLRTYHNLHRSGNVGGVELGDFKEAVHRYGMGVTDAQVEKLFRRYDKDGSGDIDFHEFLKLIMYAEDLAPQEPRETPVGLGTPPSQDAACDRPRGGVRPLTPGWISDETAAAVDGTSNDSTDKRERNGGDGGDGGDGNNFGNLPAKEGGDGGGSGREGCGAGPHGASKRKGQSRPACEQPVLGSSPVTNGAKAEDKMKACVRSRWRHMLSAFRRLDPLRTGAVTSDEFRQVLTANKATQSLQKGDLAALAAKHAIARGRVDYPRFMRHLLLGNGPAGDRSVGGVGRENDEDGGGRGSSPRHRSATSAKSTRPGLKVSMSTGALPAPGAVSSPSPRRDRLHQLRPLDRLVARHGSGGGGSGGGNELRNRAIAICRELQPHIVSVWKPLWKDFKAADESSTAKKATGSRRHAQGACGGGGGGGGAGGASSRYRLPRDGSYRGVCTGDVEAHVFRAVLARHGLELSNLDLMALEHLPAVAHKGWALKGASRGAPPPTGPGGAPAAPESVEGQRGLRDGRGTGCIDYDSFLAACLVPVVR